MIIVISLKKFINSSFWVLLATVVTKLSGFLVLPFIARILGPTSLGVYSLLFQTISTADSLSRMGVDAAMTRNGAQHESIGSEATGRLFGVGTCLIFSTGILITVLVWLFRKELAINWLGNAQIISWLGIASLTIFIAALGVSPWFYLIALQEFRFFSLRRSIVATIQVVLTVILTWGFGLRGAVWSLAIIALLDSLFGWWLSLAILHKHQIRLRFDHFIPEAISILKFGLPFYASNFLTSFVGLPLLGYVSQIGGVEQVGYLRVAQSLSSLISFLPSAIAPVLISNLSASLAAQSEDYHTLKSLHLRSLWLILLLSSLVIIFNIDWLIELLFGQKYQQSIILSRIIIWTTCIGGLSGGLSQYTLSMGNTRIMAIINTSSLVVMLGVAILLIPKYSVIGLLIAQLTSSLFSLIAYVKPALYDLKSEDRIYVKQLAFISFFSFCVSFLPMILSFSQWAYIIFSITLITTTFTFLCFQCFSKEERKTIISLTLKLVAKGKSSRYR